CISALYRLILKWCIINTIPIKNLEEVYIKHYNIAYRGVFPLFSKRTKRGTRAVKMNVKAEIKKELSEHGIDHSTIEFEPVSE
ncbi:MAG TPA: hypothetical protein PK683_08685, partial [Leptospiraceae bacterium]|nr:hypothetical protein [Leptospiraceae bacterium]